MKRGLKPCFASPAPHFMLLLTLSRTDMRGVIRVFDAPFEQASSKEFPSVRTTLLVRSEVPKLETIASQTLRFIINMHSRRDHRYIRIDEMQSRWMSVTKSMKRQAYVVRGRTPERALLSVRRPNPIATPISTLTIGLDRFPGRPEWASKRTECVPTSFVCSAHFLTTWAS